MLQHQRSPGAGRVVRMPQPLSSVRQHALPSLPPSLHVPPPGHRSLGEWMSRMVTMTQRTQGGRPRSRPRRSGPGCPQVRPPLDTSVRTETSPSLPMVDTQTGLAMAEDPDYNPPAPRRPPRPPEFTHAGILTQLLTFGAAPAPTARRAKRKTKGRFRPRWCRTTGPPPPGSLPPGARTTREEAPREARAFRASSPWQRTPSPRGPGQLRTFRTNLCPRRHRMCNRAQIRVRSGILPKR